MNVSEKFCTFWTIFSDLNIFVAIVVDSLAGIFIFVTYQLYYVHTGTDNYDTSPKYRIPSYTDRILFRCKKKHAIVCQKYDAVKDIKCSDHKPLYGLYKVFSMLVGM